MINRRIDDRVRQRLRQFPAVVLLGPRQAGKTITKYLDLMVDLLLVRRLFPFLANIGKRLVKSPKTYVRDSGLVHALLRLDDEDRVLGHPIAGMSWQGHVI